MPTQPTATLDVVVVDHANNVVSDATVRLRPDADEAQQILLSYDEDAGHYHATGVEPGRYALSVEHSRLAADERQVVIDPAGSRETFVLGRPGLPYYRRGAVKVPFEPHTDMVGVTLRQDISAAESDHAVEDMTRRGLVERRVDDTVRSQRTRVLGLTADADDLDTVVADMNQRADVERAGPIVHYDEGSVSYLTEELVVKFTDEVSEERAHHILEGAGLEVMRQIPYVGNAYQVCRPGPASYALLDTASNLDDLDEVEWAEPNLAGTYELDAVTPDDFLWNGLWDRTLVGLPDAWQSLQNAGLHPFGRPTVIIANVDQGMSSVGGAPAHPEFQGTVSNGQTKTYQLFDFRTLVPDNDSPMGNHGMGTGGVACAGAGNPSPVPGVTEGLVGAAPNCRVMGLIFPSTEVDIADMYIWAAGFNPNSPRPGFPAPINPGADVFTTSIGFGAGAPLSGVAKAMLDHLTTYGRDGKGCLAFFSAGNGNLNVTTVRPYAAYERTFGVAATTLDTDGVTEIRAFYSGHGTVELCAPSNSATGPHNPPQAYGVWSTDLPALGNLIGHPTHTTSLAGAAAAGATGVQVASVVGIGNGDRLLIRDPGAPGSEPVRVTGAPDPATGQVPCTALLNTQPAGQPVRRGPGGYQNNFGGTSSATPLSAGCAALLLSAEPDLTWVEVREIIRDTAVKLDLGNNHPIGRWLDRDGQPISVSGQPPHFSQWYGHGRINAAAAVQRALAYDFARDLMIRDNLTDAGSQPSTGPFWNSPDIWVRNQAPALEGAAALPANYATAGPHQAPVSGQDNYLYVRVRNRGSSTSYEAYVRVYLAHWPGLEFSYPGSFVPTSRPGQAVPSPLAPGTYLIGEQKISDLAAGADTTVNLTWPQALVPQKTVTIGGTTVTWHPCLLVEVSPHDGPPPTGNRVWDRNNLAQKNITIVYVDLRKLFASAVVVGNLFTASRQTFLEIDRSDLPVTVNLQIDLVDAKLTNFVKEHIRLTRPIASTPALPGVPARPGLPVQPGIPVPRDSGPGGEVRAGLREYRYAEAEAPAAVLTEPSSQPDRPERPEFQMGHVRGREVVKLTGRGKVMVPIGPIDRPVGPIVISGVVNARLPRKSYQVTVVQRDAAGRPLGAAGIELRFAADS
jgi:hypothetical protein